MGNIRKQSNELFKTRQTYIKNADPFFTATQLGYTTYADTAGTAPVDGTGGSPDITFSVNTSSPISNDADFRFVKDASNRQGQGAAFDYVIDNIHLARVLQGSVECQLISGTYATGDIRFYFIETTSGDVIEPVNVELQLGAVGITVKHIFTFQTNITNNTYRLCIHVSSSSASAYTVAFNNFKIWEPERNYGAIITDWQSYTPTFTALSGSSNINFRWRRVGDSIHVLGYASFTTASGSAQAFTLPNNYTAKTGQASTSIIGTVARGANTANNSGFCLAIDSDNKIYLGGYFGVANNPLTNTAFLGNSESLSVELITPINGWGSSIALSSDVGDGRECVAIYKNCVSGILYSSYGFNWDTKIEDSHNAVSTTNEFIFTAPFSSVYDVSGAVISNSVIPVILEKNGSTYGIIGYHTNAGNGGTFSGSVKLNTGDYIKIKTTGGTSGGSSDVIICIRSSSNNQIIAPVENVACSYYSASTQGSLTGQVNFGTKIHDSHNAVTTGAGWKFTAPMNGLYRVSVFLYGSTNTWINLYKNNSIYMKSFGYLDNGNFIGPAYTEIRLLAGEWIDIRPETSSTIEGGVSLSANNASRIEISRIGI